MNFVCLNQPKNLSQTGFSYKHRFFGNKPKYLSAAIGAKSFFMDSPSGKNQNFVRFFSGNEGFTHNFARNLSLIRVLSGLLK
jgi:hypothetical protein